MGVKYRWKGGETEMKKGLISVGVLLGFLLSVLMVSALFAQQTPKDQIVLKASNGDVTFTHKNHVEKVKLECMKCHHTWKKGETSGKLCKDCHKAKAEGKTLASKDAFHNDCKKCHDDAKKAKKAAGPTGCMECNKKAPAKK